jgi:phosphoribosylformylglycinamidine synthase
MKAVLTPNLRADALLFGESAGRIVVSCSRGAVEPLRSLARRHGVPAAAIGTVGGTRLSIRPWIDLPVEELGAAWRTALPNALTQAPRHPGT